MKRIVGISLFVFWAVTVAILVAGLVFNQNNMPDISVMLPDATLTLEITPDTTPVSTPVLTPTATPVPSLTLVPVSSPTPKPSSVSTPKPTPAPTLAPTPTPAPTITLNMAEISQHTSESDCWMVLNGNKVYSLGPYMSLHPGGILILKMYCGQDGTAAYNAVNHSAYASSQLSPYLLGNLGATIPKP